MKEQFIIFFTLYKENFTSFYAMWAPRQILWISLKNKKDEKIKILNVAK